MPRSHQHVVYSGALGNKQDPEHLVGFFSYAAQRLPGVMFHIFSDGQTYDSLRAQHSSAGRIQFHSLVPDDELAELYARSTVQIIPQAQGTSEGSLPSKLPNILQAGVPILAVCDRDSELWAIQSDVQSFVCVDDWEFPAMVTALAGLLNAPRTQGNNALARFSIDHLIRILETT
jgi:colanic acid biosynthesis glycosyl transferase WcaI